MSEQAIEVTDISKTFAKGKVKALDEVSFTVETGTVLGLLGPNGAGKTTIVRILTTILKQDSGTAKIFGLDLSSQSHVIKRLIGLAGQYAAVDENLTGFENLVMISRLTHLKKSVAKTRSLELLEQFDLTSAKDRPLKTYSGGMRRRLDLAASLVNNPNLLFLDEPTTGLDPQSRLMLWDSIQQLVKDGTTVLLTTQYLEEADRLADQIIVIDHGKVIANGTPSDLKAQFGTTIISVEVQDNNSAELAKAKIQDSISNKLIVDRNVLRIISNDGPKLALDVLRIIDANSINLAGLNISEPSLDDVFLTLTGKTIEE
jgi:daunorubicin resistance ABC transporter ATP-binding subunit